MALIPLEGMCILKDNRNAEFKNFPLHATFASTYNILMPIDHITCTLTQLNMHNEQHIFNMPIKTEFKKNFYQLRDIVTLTYSKVGSTLEMVLINGDPQA